MRFASALCFFLALASVARAQSTSALRIGALRSDARSPLALTQERVDLECEAPSLDAVVEGEAAPADPTHAPMPCTVRVYYGLTNPDAEPRSARLRFTLENAPPFEVGDDGAAGTSEAPVLSTRVFPFEASAHRTLVLSGQVVLERAARPGLASSDGIRARHPLLASGATAETRGLIYSRAVTRHFTDAPEDVVVRARVPAGHRLHVSGDGARPAPELSVDGWTAFVVHRPDSEAQPHVTIEVRTDEEELPIRNGGPFLALGGAVLWPNGVVLPNVFWGRLGYEIGFLDWLLVSAALETNFTDRFAVGVMLEAASPSFGLPPSFSIGVGSSIRVLPQPTASLRLAAGTTIFAVGFEALFDYFPSEDGFTITLLGRVGL